MLRMLAVPKQGPTCLRSALNNYLLSQYKIQGVARHTVLQASSHFQELPRNQQCCSSSAAA